MINRGSSFYIGCFLLTVFVIENTWHRMAPGPRRETGASRRREATGGVGGDGVKVKIRSGREAIS